jgi:diguanylate cyclase (GGDEF)-like protein/PAS domain S-box-containing protein
MKNMLGPIQLVDEEARLATLCSLEVLDSAPSPELDRITRIAARLFGVPIALVSLIDSDRQWFKSRVGFELTETPRRQSFCTIAIQGEGALVLPDLLADQRFCDNPFVREPPHLRFYAGYPVRSREGHALGTLCLLDHRPRVFDADDVQMLQDLAGMVEQHMRGLEAAMDARRARTALARNEQLFERTITQAAVGIALASPEGLWLELNQRFCDILGQPHERLIGAPIRQIVHPEDRSRAGELLRRVLAGESAGFDVEVRFMRADGSSSWAQLGGSMLTDEHGQPQHLIAVATDINRRKRFEQELETLQQDLEQRIEHRTGELREALAQQRREIAIREAAEAMARDSEMRLTTITDNVPAMIAYIDRDLRYRFHNRIYFDWFALGDAGLIGRDARDFWGTETYQHLRPALAQVLSGAPTTVEYSMPSRTGEMWFYASLVPHVDASNEVVGFYLLAQDITERKRIYQRLEDESRQDALTGLPNRRALMQHLHEAMARAMRHQRPMAVLFMDLDRFKQMNDTLGHEFGDAVLIHFSAALAAVVRETDYVARLAGDEFVIVLEDLALTGQLVEQVAGALLDRITPSAEIQGVEVTLSASIGAAMHDGHEEQTAQELLGRADAAMYRAKAAGVGGFSF